MKALLYIPTNIICKFCYTQHNLCYNVDKFINIVQESYNSIDEVIYSICNTSNWGYFYIRNKLPISIQRNEFEIIDIDDSLEINEKE